MADGIAFILLIAVLVALVLIIAKLASFWKRFAKDLRYICRKMDHAKSYEAYYRWRGELRCRYLMLIPFVTEKNVMRVYDCIFDRADRAKSEERKDSIAPLLMPSILGICICLVCVCGMTWAWYTASIETPTQKMTAAYYEVTVETVMKDEAKIESNTDGSYSLAANTTYTIILKADGSVKECGGYCLIENAEKNVTFYTQTFKPKESITIQFKPTEAGAYTFTGVWGSIPLGVDESHIIKANKEDASAATPDNPNALPTHDDTAPAPVNSTEPPVDETPVDDGTYTVKAGDTLSAIAAKYNTTVDIMAAYNGIADKEKINAGQVLNIPPQNYVLPTPTVPHETMPSESEPVPPVPSDTQTSDISATEPVTDSTHTHPTTMTDSVSVETE